MNEIGRNNPCPCGSGKKYKNCCLDSDQTAKIHEAVQQYDNWQEERTTAIISTCMVTSMEILQNEFGFTQEQLTKFAEMYPEVLQKSLKDT